ncbi:YdcF family protein [Corynebacterium pacaense]|uniref:YdcF family protein n=1 Tax=Corynebacterium pacaense TaxID=1816684 RepID=UPI0009BC4035|nr:YdcF family protein [Corynebacterium pacaense]
MSKSQINSGGSARGGLRILLRAAALLLTALVVGAVAFIAWLLLPPNELPPRADVVMVVAGASDGRHELGARIVDDLDTRSFVVSNPNGTRDVKGSSFCRGVDRPRNAETWCLDPHPVTTAGEAMTLGELAREQGWESAVIVTNRPHSRRVEYIFRDCTDLQIDVVHISTVNLELLPYHLAREAAGFGRHLLADPCAHR